MLAMIDTHAKIAEIGCGSGYLAKQMVSLGADMMCCDITKRSDLLVGYNLLPCIRHLLL
jgi:protein-L-isoaspartate O-methyltransferase